ncbi:MAG: hypothetical protein ACAI25_11295 [Planctomycetota bacterium]
MRTHTCSRCRKAEQIPTNQLVKFDASFHDLCRDCWQGFRSWFYAGERIARVAESTDDAANAH